MATNYISDRLPIYIKKLSGIMSEWCRDQGIGLRVSCKYSPAKGSPGVTEESVRIRMINQSNYITCNRRNDDNYREVTVSFHIKKEVTQEDLGVNIIQTKFDTGSKLSVEEFTAVCLDFLQSGQEVQKTAGVVQMPATRDEIFFDDHKEKRMVYYKESDNSDTVKVKTHKGLSRIFSSKEFNQLFTRLD